MHIHPNKARPHHPRLTALLALFFDVSKKLTRAFDRPPGPLDEPVGVVQDQFRSRDMLSSPIQERFLNW